MILWTASRGFRMQLNCDFRHYAASFQFLFYFALFCLISKGSFNNTFACTRSVCVCVCMLIVAFIFCIVVVFGTAAATVLLVVVEEFMMITIRPTVLIALNASYTETE